MGLSPLVESSSAFRRRLHLAYASECVAKVRDVYGSVVGGAAHRSLVVWEVAKLLRRFAVLLGSAFLDDECRVREASIPESLTFNVVRTIA